MNDRLLRGNAVLFCPHGGRVNVPQDKLPKMTVIGSEDSILTTEALEDAPIACPLPTKPCTKVLKVVVGRAEMIGLGGKIPVTASVLFLTDSVPPGIGRCVSGLSSIVQGTSFGSVSPAQSSRSSPPPSRSGKDQYHVVRLRFEGLSPGSPPPDVSVIVVQSKPVERVWSGWVTVPVDGKEVHLTTDLPASQEAWAVITSAPLGNELNQVEVGGTRPWLVASAREPQPLTADARKHSVSTYKELINHGPSGAGVTPRVAALANGLRLEKKEKPQPPVGGVLRTPIRLTSEPITLRLGYPRLAALADATVDSDSAIAHATGLLALNSAHPLPERLALARLCTELVEAGREKFLDTFTTTYMYAENINNNRDLLQKKQKGPLYQTLLDEHVRRSPEIRASLLKRFDYIRSVFGSMDELVNEYVSFVWASPFFLGTRDEPRLVNLPDALFNLYLASTIGNAALRTVQDALTQASECLFLTAFFATDADDTEMQERREWMANIVNMCWVDTLPVTNGTSGIGPKLDKKRESFLQSFGWKVANKVIKKILKKGREKLADPQELQKFRKSVNDAVKLTLNWVEVHKPYGKAVDRTLNFFDTLALQFGLVPINKKIGRDQVKAIGASQLRTARGLLAVLVTLQTYEIWTKESRIHELDSDVYLRWSRTVHGVLETVLMVADHREIITASKALIAKRKLSGTNRKVLTKVAAKRASLKTIGKRLTWLGYGLDVIESGRDIYIGDTTRAALRMLPFVALLSGPWAFFAMGLAIEYLLAEGGKSTDELKLDELLRKTEFGTNGPDGRSVPFDSVRNRYENGPSHGTTGLKEVRDFMTTAPWKLYPIPGGAEIVFTAMTLFAAPSKVRLLVPPPSSTMLDPLLSPKPSRDVVKDCRVDASSRFDLDLELELEPSQEGYSATLTLVPSGDDQPCDELYYHDLVEPQKCWIKPPPVRVELDKDNTNFWLRGGRLKAPVRILNVPIQVGGQIHLIVGRDRTHAPTPAEDLAPAPLAKLLILDPFTNVEIARRSPSAR